MRANYMPTPWNKLPKREREAIEAAYDKQLDHDEAEIQKVWLQMGVIVNHVLFGHDEAESLAFLKEWKKMYRIISQFKSNEERDEWLNRETAKIFGEGGYPHEWVDSLENGGKRNG